MATTATTTMAAHAGRKRRRHWLRWLVLLLALAGPIVYLAYARDMRATRNRLAAGSQIVTTRQGPIEYTSWGEGPAALVCP